MTMTEPRQWEARNPEYESIVRGAFEAQNAMATIGARLERVAPGFVEIHLPIRDAVMSHIPGIVHGGTLGMVADSALGFAALTLAEPNAVGVTAEYKINMLSPAMGDTVIARGEVLKSGRKVIVGTCDVLSVKDGEEKLVAHATATLIAFG